MMTKLVLIVSFCSILFLVVEEVACQHAHFSTGWSPGFGIGKRQGDSRGAVLDCSVRPAALQRILTIVRGEVSRYKQQCGSGWFTSTDDDQ